MSYIRKHNSKKMNRVTKVLSTTVATEVIKPESITTHHSEVNYTSYTNI